MRGRFITFEGLDGSGKSTHLRRVKAWLDEAGVPSVLTHEPGGTPFADEVRRAFKSHEIDATTELFLVFASRRHHLREVIEPALAAGRHVLCDRFTDSTYVYQGRIGGVADEVIATIDRIATGSRVPDRTLVFDATAATAHARGSGRERRDRFDDQSLAVYERVREAYLERARREPDRIAVVSTEGEIEAAFGEVRSLLGDLLTVLAEGR